MLSISTIVALGVRDRRKISQMQPAAGIQLDLACRYAVGVERLMHGLGNAGAANVPTLAASVRSAAIAPVDQLRIIPVLVELQGGDSADGEIDRFLKTHPTRELANDAGIFRQIYDHGPQSVSREDAGKLQSRHRWFGQLALSYSLPDTNPLRAKVLNAATRTVYTIIVFGAGAIAALVTGVVLLIILIIHWAEGKLIRKYVLAPPSPASADAFIEGFAVYLGLMAAMSLAARILPPAKNIAWEALLAVPVLGAIFWVRLRGIAWPQLSRDLGWVRGRGIFREMWTGIIAYITGLPLIVAMALISTFLAKLNHTRLGHPIEHFIQGPASAQIMVITLAAVFAPLAEETLFRGMLQAHLRLRHGWLFSALLMSLIFAGLHPQGWEAIPVLGMIAMILAALRELRVSLIASMTAHALNNLAVVLLLILAAG